MKKLSSTLPNMLLSLTGICIIIAGILAGMNKITAAPIEQAKVKAKVDAIKNVTPAFDNNPYNEAFSILKEGDADSVHVYPAKKGNDIVGYAVESYTNSGFNGRISVMVGFDNAGKLVDYSVLEHGETPGLGSKMQEWFHQPSKTSNLQDLKGVDMAAQYPLVVSKDGGKVDAITAATISSRAFLDAINRAYDAVKQAKEKEAKK